MNARLFNVNTGEIVWADEARNEDSTTKVSVGGFGGGVDDEHMFDKVMKPTASSSSSPASRPPTCRPRAAAFR